MDLCLLSLSRKCWRVRIPQERQCNKSACARPEDKRCKGVIPYPKKKAYKVLYNANRIKIKENKMRDATMQGEFLEF
jgi:hypothetical protein